MHLAYYLKYFTTLLIVKYFHIPTHWKNQGIHITNDKIITYTLLMLKLIDISY